MKNKKAIKKAVKEVLSWKLPPATIISIQGKKSLKNIVHEWMRRDKIDE